MATRSLPLALLAGLLAAAPPAGAAAARPSWMPPAAGADARVQPAARAAAPDAAVARAATAPARLPAGAGELVVGATRWQDLDAVVAAARRAGTVIAVRRALSSVVVRVADRRAAAAALRGRADVAFVETPRVRRSLAHFDAVEPATGLPGTWWFSRVGASDALALVPGAPFPVAVIDTGTDVTHPELAGRLAPSYDALHGGGSTVTDVVGHGTFIAGLLSGKGDGIAGVAGTTKVMTVRAGDTQGLPTTAIVDGIVHAVEAGAKVINMSFGSGGISGDEQRALDYALASDVVLVASSGNSAEEKNPANPVQYPAAYIGGVRGGWSDGGISVGASTESDARAGFSTFNDAVGIVAPGAVDSPKPLDTAAYGPIDAAPCLGILSLATSNVSEMADDAARNQCLEPGIAPPVTYNGGRYVHAQGTSFSGPIVAGAAALVRAARPALSNAQVVRVLQVTAALYPAWSQQVGFGRLRMREAVERAQTWDATAPQLLSATGRGNGTRVLVSATAQERVSSGEVPLGNGLAYFVDRSSDGGKTWKSQGPLNAVDRLSVPLVPGKNLRIQIYACDESGNCAVRALGPFRWKQRPPAVTAKAVTGRATGGTRKLRFTVKDLDSAAVKLLVVVYRGGAVSAKSRPQRVAIRKGRVEGFYLRWQANAAGQRAATRWCVTATDVSGAGKKRACASIRLR